MKINTASGIAPADLARALQFDLEDHVAPRRPSSSRPRPAGVP